MKDVELTANPLRGEGTAAGAGSIRIKADGRVEEIIRNPHQQRPAKVENTLIKAKLDKSVADAKEVS